MKRAGMIGRVFVALVLVLFGLTSCQVGLGAAVDTSDPRAGIITPSVSYPSVGGPTIHIAGTCEDDTGIAEVLIVELRNVESGEVYSELGVADLSDNGTAWSFDLVRSGSSGSTYSVNDRELKLPDGRYELTILPVDLGGRSPRYGVTRTIEIDNTPPIFLISTPNSTDINDPAPFGQTVKVKGVIIDDHEIKGMDVKVYDTTGSVVNLGTTGDFERVQSKDKDNFSVILGKKEYKPSETPDETALSNYTILYPDGSTGQKFYYMEVVLEDAVNIGTDLPGNRSRLVYFKTPLFNKLQDLGINILDSGELKRGYNGTSSIFTAQQCETIRQVLDGTYDDDESYYARVSENSEGRLAFSVNPNNNPKYSFGGMAYTDSNPATWRSNKAAAGGTVTLMVSASSDEEDARIHPDTIVVKLIPVDDDGHRLDSEAILSTSVNGPKIELGTTPVESATYTVTLPDNLTYTYYELEATGEDGLGKTLEANADGYGFMLYSNKIPVTITTDDDQKFFSKSDSGTYPFSIRVNDSNSMVTINTTGSIKYRLKTVNEYKSKQYFTAEDTWTSATEYTIPGTDLISGGEAGEFTKEIDIPFSVLSNSVGTVAIRLWGDNGKESEKNVYVIYVDDKKPTLKVNNNTELNTKLVKENSTYYLASEGKYTVSGTWQDENGAGAKILEYILDGGTNWTPIGEEYESRVTDSLNWSFSIPVTDGGGNSISVRAKDRVGNVTQVDYSDIIFDLGSPVFSNVPELTEADYIDVAGRTFAPVATDGFGLQDITVVAKQDGTIVASGSNGYSLTVTDTVAGNNKSKTATVRIAPASNADGKWKIELTATDLNGRSTPTTFGFTFDHTKPEVNDGVTIGDSTYNASAWQKDRSARISGTVDEAISLKSLYYLVRKSDETLLTGTPTDITGMAGVQSVAFTNKKGTVPFSITVDGLTNNESHGNVVYIQPVDGAGNKGDVESYTINVDQVVPELKALKYRMGGVEGNASGTVAVNGQSMTLYGTYSDGASGVNALGFEIGSTSVVPTDLKYTTSSISGATDDARGAALLALPDSAWKIYNSAEGKQITGFKATIDSGDFASGTVRINGSDAAGNSTSHYSVTLKKDNVKPTVSNVSIEGAYRKTDTVYYVNNTTTQIKVKGVSADDYALNSTVVTIPGLASSPITLSGTSWTTDSLNIAGLTGSSVTITVVSHDTAGNESNPTSITLNFDTTAPSRKNDISKPSWGSESNWRDNEFKIGGGAYNAESYSGSTTLEVTGTFIEEGSGVAGIYYELVNGNGAHEMTGTNYRTKGKLNVPNDDGTFAITVTGLQEGSNNLRIIAVDNTGNVSEIGNYAVRGSKSDFVLNLDQTAPAFGNAFALADADGYVTGKENFTVTGGTVSDGMAGVDHDTLKFWFVDKNDPATRYEITGTAATDYSSGKDVTTIENARGKITYRANDSLNRSATIELIIKADDTWFTETNLGSAPILYGSVLDYSNPGNNSGTATILTTIKLDQTAPAIAIDSNLNTTPITDENDGGKIKKVGDNYFYELTGTWSDANGSGTDKLFYSINNGTDWIDADSLATKNYAKSKAESSWSLNIPVVEGSSYNFAVKAKDAAGNEKEAKPNKTVTFDFSKPTITVDLDSGVYGQTRPQATVTASDHYQISGITVVSATKDGTAAVQGSDYVLSNIAGAGTSSATRVVTIQTDGVFEFTFKASDANGRDSDSITRTWTVDTVAPAVKADNDATYGLKINGEEAGTWYRDTNLRFDGRVDEKVSGLSKVYYIVSSASSVSADTVKAGNQQNYSNVKNTGAGGNVPVAYSVTPTVTDGTSYVHMIFEDAAGNTSGIKTNQIKLDRRAPTFTKDYYSYEEGANYSAIGGTVLSNKTKDLYLAGSYSDDDSGVKELKFDVNGLALTSGTECVVKYSTDAILSGATNIGTMTWKNYSEIADKTSIKSYRAMIKKNKLAAGSVSAETSDVTGNGSSQAVCTITIDEDAPVLTLNTPKTKRLLPIADAEDVNIVNGTITFAGTTDESSMDHLDLYWGTTSSATANIDSDHLIDTKTAAQSYNWSFSVPLSRVDGGSVKFIDGSTYAGSPKDIYLKLIAADKAGNTASYVYRYKVDPDGDRPIITFTQLDLSGLTENETTSNVWLTDNKKMTGNVIDDDGVRELWYSLDGGAWTKLPDANENTFANGNFAYTFTAETKYSMKFKVVDGAGTTFETKVNPNPQYLAPKFVGTNPETCNYSILNLAVDISSPVINNVKYIANNGTDQEASTDFELKRFGGDWKKVKFQFNTSDTNGIKTAKVSFNGNDYAASKVGDTDTYITNDFIPLDALASKNYTAVIIVTDNANREGKDSTTASFVVDNDAPTVRISQPSGLVSMATQAVGSLSEVNGLAHVYFMVTQKNVNPETISDFATAEQNGANKWKEYANLEAGTSSFEIAFDSATGDNHTDLLKWYLAYVGLTTVDAINGTNGATRYTDLTDIDLHIMAVDSYGNVGYGTKTVQVDPQGDKPTVTITYPLEDSTLGGAIPIMGTAIDNVGADNIMVLMDMNDDGKWNKTDIDALNALNPAPSWLTWGKFDLNPSTEKYEWTEVTYSQIIAQTSAFETNDVKWTKYGIKRTVSNASWSFTVNQGGELNPSGSTARRNLALWVYSTDTDGNSSQINLTDHTKMPYVAFIIDKDTPQITNEYLVQYDNSGVFSESHVTAKYAYTKDMSIKGEWYYEADMTDESGIEKVTRYTLVDGASVSSREMTSAGSYEGGEIVLSAIEHGYHIRMKVGTNDSDSVVYQNWKIVCQESDGQHLTGESEIALNVDNKAPDVIEEGDFYNMGQAFTIAGHDYRKVTNENGFFTFGTQAKEDAVDRVSQTGVKRIAFYFTRDIDTTHQLYDVMIAKGESGNAINTYTSLSKEDGLYWKTLTGSSSGRTFTLSGSDLNVHTGGLVKINGVIYRIESVSGRTVTIEVNTTEENPFSGVTSAKFALANVVDNPTEENADETSGKTAGYYNHVNFDDGDLMVESLKKQGTTWTWEANINSKNIGDGKAVLHYVVFDAAGNSVEKTLDVFVANNQPRIAGVSIGTDTNGDGTVDAAEMISEGYSNIYAKGKQGSRIMTEAWFPSDKSGAVLKIIGNTKIKPEIVGGNGRLDYSYAAYESNGAGSWSDAPLITGNGTNIGTGQAVGTEAGETEEAQTLTVDLSMAELLGMGNAESTNFALTVSDQTPGASLSATLNIIVDTLLLDNNVPKSHIIPFYWVNGTKNSLFMDSREYGHIELPNDLPVSFTAEGEGVDDRDPKLSGIVKIEGIAHDDVLLSQLKVKVGATEYTLGTYNGSWTVTNNWDGSTIPTDYACRITNTTYREAYNMGFITPEEFNALNDLTKDSAIDYVTAKYGHLVHWTLYLNTSVLGTGADIAIMTSASDRGRATSTNGVDVTYNPNTWTEEDEASHSASASVSDSGTPTGYQKVDVVPYIAKVYTGLAKLKSNNWSVYNRTALGHYAIASSETVYLYGFNLGDSDNKPKYGEITLDAPVNGGVTNASYPSGANYASYSVVAFPASNVTRSGAIEIKVGDITTLNNRNKTDAKGSYTGTTSSVTGDKSIYDNYYNRQPNGDNNNLLTDDVWFDVWQINSNVAQAQGSAYITEPIMKINPVSGMLNFAFNSGPGNFTMANGTTTSYTTWLGNLARMSTAGFTVDENGVTHGITVGLDTNPSSGSAGRMQYLTSKWGQALSYDRDKNKLGTQGNYEGTQSSRFETIGAPKGTYNGVSYSEYIFMEDRFASPSIVTSIHTEGEDESAEEHTYVFVAYYDDINAQIRFRYGDLNDTVEHTDGTPKNTIGRSFGGFQDAWVYGWGKTGDGNHKSFDTNTRPQDYSVIAASGVSGNYLSIDLIKGDSVDEDIIVATWQDSAHEKWYYAYKKKPCTDNDLGSGTGEGYWSTPILLASDAGQDCHISVDPRGGIHLAAYDSSEADLIYAYLENYGDSTPQVVTVDSYAFTGEHLTLDTAFSADGNYVVPLIGYYMGSAKKPKIARLDNIISATDGSGTIPEGVDDNEACTGKWETSIIPTESKYADNYAYSHVNVGIWKDSDGKIKSSNRPPAGTTNIDKWVGNNKKVGDETKGYFWGNGTDNPVLGYAIKIGTRGYIETAQMK